MVYYYFQKIRLRYFNPDRKDEINIHLKYAHIVKKIAINLWLYYLQLYSLLFLPHFLSLIARVIGGTKDGFQW